MVVQIIEKFLGLFGKLNIAISVLSFIASIFVGFSEADFGMALFGMFLFLVSCGAIIIGVYSLYIHNNFYFIGENEAILFPLAALPVASFLAFVYLIFFRMIVSINVPGQDMLLPFALLSLPLMIILNIIIAILKKQDDIKTTKQAIKEIQQNKEE